MFTSLSGQEPSLRGHRVRVYRPVELNSLSDRMADIYVLRLFQPLLANYPADQSAAQPASCLHPLWQFVSQACCSVTDAVGVRAPLCCRLQYAECGGLFVAFGVKGLWVSSVYTHTICINTHVYIQYAGTCVFVCVFVYTICSGILAAVLFKPLCPLHPQ